MKQRLQLVLITRENMLLRNYLNECQSHIDRFSQFIYTKYAYLGKTFRDKFYKPYQQLKKSHQDVLLHDKGKKYVMAFLDLFNTYNAQFFDPTLEEFYSGSGNAFQNSQGGDMPDISRNERISDLIKAYNLNQKLLISNLNDYEKLFNLKVTRETLTEAKHDEEEDEEVHVVEPTYENFSVNPRKSFTLIK